MKLPGQEDFEGSDAHENVCSEQLDGDLGPGSGLDGPSDIDNGKAQGCKDPLLFIQLNELLGWPQALEWRETGRWLLFEEKLDIGAGRWSAPHVPTLALPSLQKLRGLLAEGIVLLDCPARSLLELVEQVVSGESLSPELRGQLQALLLQRPQHHIQTTGIRPCRGSNAFRKASRDEDTLLKHQNPLRQKLPPGAEAAAVLAGELGFLEQPLAAFVRLQNPVVLEPLTEVVLPSRFFCLLLGPPTLGRSYHETGRAAAVLLSDPQFQWSVRRASNLHDLLAALDAFLQEVTALPPGRWDRTARIPPPKCLPSQHKRFPSKLQEVTSLSRQSAALAENKHHHGPHTPIPELQRTGSVSQRCSTFTWPQSQMPSLLGVFWEMPPKVPRDYSLDYLPFRLWVGIWVATFCLALVATEASLLVRYFTRFTEEGFCALISLIFIYDAVGKMLNLIRAYPIQRPGSPAYSCFCQYPGTGGNASEFDSTMFKDTEDVLNVHPGLVNASFLPPSECIRQGGYPRGPSCHTVPDIAFFSLLLFFTSFLCAIALKHVKNSRLFPSVVRKVFSDFSSVLAILLGCGLDAFLGLATPKLLVPTEFKPTLPGRGWLVSPFGANPWWLSVAAALPALLLSILIFMDQQITAVILNRAEYRLQKGAGFHLDLFCVAVLMLFTSALGLPWYVSATVISLAHMDSLRRESKACVPGEDPNFLGIREQRLTGLVVFILTGVSIFLAPVLKFIPMPVLYGIFLYMGVAALSSMQFMKRVQLLLMPRKHQPDVLLLRHVPLIRVHLFTAIQLACLGLLWVIKSTPAAIVFPLMLLGLVAVRKALEWIFSPQELLWLDELMPEEEKTIPENRPEPEHLFSGNDSENSELMYQPKAPEINISVN
ncbi:solute carrier family 4, sodium bicarbonate cotransporter, member 9, isoform CRA_a [Rattus norvegicus]|uniref:Solute carrier family 4, sodium bicarbonate cotransporter, member 9, isoform CRA_a n=1 Tax=Rattus norvegicus TaxID=10116 RepID=A6J314_RAT|nr:solute carrier family 4, sodium bicarbonate cotransporter, member 9, isoform CRA_a [Rattus norvegicus]|eukprot:XP_008770245.1 PREDICTED: anion exchange protein 4 isoform X5 [Rattus norvegicus]